MRDYYAANHSHQNSPPNSQTATRNILNKKIKINKWLIASISIFRIINIWIMNLWVRAGGIRVAQN